MKDGTYKLIDDIKREAGNGCLKAIKVCVIVDSAGNIVGRSEFKTTKIFPRSLEEQFKGLENQLAEVFSD